MIEINNITFFAVDKKFFLGVAKKALKGENKEKKNLSVVFVPASEMKKLNKKYRRKNKATDVLSFCYKPFNSAELQRAKASGSKTQIQNKKLSKKELFGEVVICPAIVRENAKKYNIDFKEELTKVLIHGILHLLGYDHEKTKKQAEIMEKREKYYLSTITLK